MAAKCLRCLFFRECDSFFKSPNLKKKIFQKTILSLKFKFRVVFLEYFFFEIWRFEKRIALSEKKPPLVCIKKKVGAKFTHV